MASEAATTAGARIAFFAPLTLLAEEIRRALEGRAFPIADVKLYDEAEEGTLSEFSGEPLVVTRPDQDIVSGLDLAFMCGSAVRTLPYLDWPGRHGFVAIDISGAGGGRPDVPIVHAGINPAAMAADGLPHPVIAVPGALSHNLASVAAAASAAGTLDRLDAVSMRPAADCGKEGIDELHRQTVALLNFAAVPRETLGRQLAFNMLPAAGGPRGRDAHDDAACALETSRLLQLDPDRVGVASTLVSCFHGHLSHVTMTFSAAVGQQEVREAIEATRGIRIIEDPVTFSPVDLAGEEEIAVFLPEVAAAPRRRVTLWTFCDNLKGGAALNAVRVAERALDLLRGAGR